MKFEKLDKIDIKKQNSWKKKIFLTFDLEWASDEAINFLIDLLLEYDVKATFFLTHDSKAVRRILKYKQNFSVGLHPNYNFLLENNERKNINFESIFLKLYNQFKNTKSVRAHSLVNGSKLTSLYKKKGIKYLSNSLCYKVKNLKPWKDFNNIVNLPIVWADDISLYLNDLNKNLNFVNNYSLNILDFHPTAVFLNSCDYKKNYIAHRKQNKMEHLKKYTNLNKYGVRDFLIDIITKKYK